MASQSAPKPFPNLRIRPYEPRDFETLYQIDEVCYPRGMSYPRPVLRRFLFAEGARTLVAESGDDILGFLIVQDHGRARGHVITIDVLAEHRRSGVGTALLRVGEDWLAQQGVKTVELETSVQNAPALALFQRFGYQVVRYLPDYYRNHSDAYLMEKALTPIA